MTNMQKLRENNLIAIMRGVNPDDAISIFQSLNEGGIKVFEITLDSPKAFELIEKLSHEAKDDVRIGAGTVLDPESARRAISYGAQFIISPTLNLRTIEMAKRHGVLSIPGCLTPTEILSAYEHGADLVKVFPAGSMGANYFKDIAGPLPYIPLIATGGINTNNIQSYIQAGAAAVGIGSSLVPKQCTGADELHELTQKASKLVQLVSDCKVKV